jgi:hypothetical protein
VFFEKLFITHPELRGVYSDSGLFFKDLLVKEKIIGLLGKLAYDVFEVFYSKPMAVINPALYQETIELKLWAGLSILSFSFLSLSLVLFYFCS